MKTCFIEQPAGLGDILLGSKIGNHFANLGHRVVWPVSPTYSYINHFISTEGVEYVDMSSDYNNRSDYERFVSMELKEVHEDDNFIHVPTRRSFFSAAGQSIDAANSHDAANMHGKFAMCSITHDNWQDYFELKRDTGREDTLFNAINPPPYYHLVNKNFGTPPRWKEILNHSIHVMPPYQRLNMTMDPRYTVFDWLKIIENAGKIDTVSTSTFYLFEKMDLKCIPTIYSRNNSDRSYQENFGWLQDLARKDYLFIN